MSVEIHTDEQLADSPVLQAVFGEALPKIEVFHGKLQAEGEERGLIGPRDVDIIWERHLLNSAAIVPFVAEKTEGRQFKTVADLGSGGGIPGARDCRDAGRPHGHLDRTDGAAHRMAQ